MHNFPRNLRVQVPCWFVRNQNFWIIYEFAASSFQKAEKAQKAGWFEDEIVPVKTTIKDPKTGDVKEIVVDRDDGIRYGTTAEGLGKSVKSDSETKIEVGGLDSIPGELLAPFDYVATIEAIPCE